MQAKSFLVGKPPKALIQKAPNPEIAKYKKAWDIDDYRRWSPGERCVPLFLETAKPKDGATFIDWGCGSGRAGLAAHKAGLDVTLIDFADNCLDPEVREALGDKFVEHDLTKRIHRKSDYGMCCDVMEHIPPEDVDKVLDNILSNSQHVFFQISTVPDHFGKQVGEPLHLTVEDYQWWLRKFVDLGVIIHHSNEFRDHVIFYVTGWGSIFSWNKGQVNTSNEQILEHMRENAKLGIQQIKPHEQQEIEVMLLAGGPSLNDFEDEIIRQRAEGMPLITANGTYHWALERGLKPSMQIMIDAREFNRRFVTPVVDDCKYVISSQCHPSVFKSLPKERTYMWQVSLSDEQVDLATELWGEPYPGSNNWFACPGGSTVILRGLCLLRMLGLYKVHLYGFDSCLREQDHHAYPQPENDRSGAVEMFVAKGTPFEKSFWCQPWMAYQAKEFKEMIPRLFRDMKLDVKGDGLISYMIQSGAEAAEG